MRYIKVFVFIKFGYWYKSLTRLNLGLRSDTPIHSTIMPIWLARILMRAKQNTITAKYHDVSEYSPRFPIV